MGVTGAGMFQHKSIDLCWEHICHLVFELSHQRGTDITPCIDVDANNTAFNSLSSPIRDIQRPMDDGVNDGVELCRVEDEHICHSSKRATVKRSAQREVMGLKAIELEFKLSSLLQNNSSHPEAPELEKLLEKSYKTATNTLPFDFTVQLSLAIDAMNTNLIKFMHAKLQADPDIFPALIESLRGFTL